MTTANSAFQIRFEEGITLDQLVPVEERAKVAASVADVAMTGLISGLKVAAVAPQLAAGAVLYAGAFVINIANAVYRINFELVTTRALVAAEVFDGAIDYVRAMKENGRMDSEVADITLNHLYKRLREILPD